MAMCNKISMSLLIILPPLSHSNSALHFKASLITASTLQNIHGTLNHVKDVFDCSYLFK